jgi:putative ABC transport system permease protein
LFRRMFRSPGFSAMVVITIALAIGVNLGIFSITHAILFKSLGVPDADRLVYYTLGSGPDTRPIFSGPAYEALRANPATKDVLAWKQDEFRRQIQGELVKLTGAYVTGNAFSVFGLKPTLGRFFDESEDAPGGGKNGWTAVLGYSYWRTSFDANPAVIGQSITIDGVPVRIVGVLPREFIGIVPLNTVDILLPHHFQAISNPREDRFSKPNYLEWNVLGRLPKGLSIQSIQANLKVIEPSFRRMGDPENMMFSSSLFANTPTGSLLTVWDGRIGVIPLKTVLPPVLAMEGLAGIVLVFSCCNLILLFLGRASREAHVAAIRMALGARLGDEVRFATLELTLLAAIGCMIGVPLAWGIVRALSLAVLSTARFDISTAISPSASLLATSSGIILVVACLSAAGASLWNAGKRSSITLKEGRSATSMRSRSWIIGFEVFASILLITTTIVGAIGIQKLASQPSGFGAGTAVMASLDLRANSGTAAASKSDSSSEQTARILERIESSPGVQSAATMNVPPLDGASTSGTVEVHDAGGGVRDQQVWPAFVSTGYFAAIGTRIVQGRAFTNDDLAGGPVCVLSSRAAAILFSRKDPLGQYLYRGSAPPCRVVGVAEDAHFESMSTPAEAVVYQISKTQFPNIVVRAATTGLAIQAVRNAVQAVAPAGLASSIETIEAHVDNDLRVRKVLTLSGALCACMAACILVIGFFGILSLQVSERKREIGIQIALGASRRRVCTSIARKLRLSLAIGLILGSGGALLAAQELAKLYNLNTQFVIAGYLGSLVLLGLLLLAAASVPLTRALNVSPMECLSSE